MTSMNEQQLDNDYQSLSVKPIGGRSDGKVSQVIISPSLGTTRLGFEHFTGLSIERDQG